MKIIKKAISDFKKSVKAKYRALVDNKKALDFIAAALTIPVMLTLIISNYYNIQNKKKTEPERGETEKEITPIEVKVNISPGQRDELLPTLAPTPELNKPTATPTEKACKLDPAPIKIIFPKEGEVVIDDPVCIDIEVEEEDEYCGFEWAYRVNNAGWSGYSSSQICLFNMKTGGIKLDVRVRNIESGRTKTYTRNFVYQGELSLTSTPILSPIPSD